jgi:hypothetical protein
MTISLIDLRPKVSRFPVIARQPSLDTNGSAAQFNPQCIRHAGLLR